MFALLLTARAARNGPPRLGPAQFTPGVRYEHGAKGLAALVNHFAGSAIDGKMSGVSLWSRAPAGELTWLPPAKVLSSSTVPE